MFNGADVAYINGKCLVPAGQGQKERISRQLVGRCLGILVIDLEGGSGLGHRINQRPPEHSWADGMESELEGGDNAKVPASAPYAPEQVWVLSGTCSEDAAFGRDEIDGEQVVASKTLLMRQPTHPAPEGQAGHTGMGNDARGGGQAQGLGRTVEVS